MAPIYTFRTTTSHVPIHLGVHWATVAVDFVAKEIVYYDSKPNKITSVTPPCLYSIRYVIKTCLI